MRRARYSPAIVFFLVNVAYLHILATVNSALSPYAALILPCVFIIGPSLFLKGWQAALVVGVSALLWEASTPVRPALACALWLAAAFCVRAVRFRFRPLDGFSVCALAQVVNIALIFAYFALFPNGCADFGDYVLRVFADSLLSSAVLIFAARFAILAPLSILKFAGVELKIEEDF